MNIKQKYAFKSKIWIYQGGKASWHFLHLPKDISAEIKFLTEDLPRAWGSVPVIVTIGQTTWKTSIFRDSKAEAYILPLKVDVRKRELLSAGDEINIAVELL